ncbi:hypothetical protein CIPAW_16G001300 [Carya illinoinensis]|uniref:Uncharacterized protein n=1 Tax=Carya illinoinensis TaxID=32201 RepID=A0A8T1N4Y6_CARIL|nr:hypothetical protein CIPAW_16G001300 [Carya illinoinensis]
MDSSTSTNDVQESIQSPNMPPPPLPSNDIVKTLKCEKYVKPKRCRRLGSTQA